MISTSHNNGRHGSDECKLEATNQLLIGTRSTIERILRFSQKKKKTLDNILEIGCLYD